ncbi:MAG: glycosyltransferase family 4 protein [Motiliproteus sp.]
MQRPSVPEIHNPAALNQAARPLIAFYAPLKPPTHPNPSGDRLLGRLLQQALHRAGFEPQLASIFRSYDRDGDPTRQQRLKAIATRLAARLIRRYQRLPAAQRPALWFSYHLYHKAPDWIGPIVSRALQIPYVVVEASYARKQADGPWHLGLQDSAEALQQAAMVLCLNPADHAGIRQCRADAPLHALAPFLDLTPFDQLDGSVSKAHLARTFASYPSPSPPPNSPLDPTKSWLICVAMMRPGDKLRSYQKLSEALQPLKGQQWQLIVVGDGKARNEVENAFSTLRSQVCFTGKLSPQQLQPLLHASDLYLWPAVNEAFGMALLEAQAAATPVLAGDEGGVSSVVDDGNSGWLVAAGDSRAFSDQLQRLLQQPQRLQQAGQQAQQRVTQRHSLDAAGQRLRQLLSPLINAATDRPDR